MKRTAIRPISKTRLVQAIYPVALWLVGFGLAIKFTLLDFYEGIFIGDTGGEYLLYLEIIESGKWENVSDSLQASCLTTTYFPAMIQRATSIDPLLLFRVFPCIILAFLPPLVYFVSKKYLLKHYAFLAGIFISAQVCFLWSTLYARSNVALTFVALLILVVLSDNWSWRLKIPLLLVSSIGVVFSHYGTAYITLSILGLAVVIMWFITLLKRRELKSSIIITVSFILLLSSFLIWFNVASVPLNYGKAAINTAIDEVVEEFKPTDSKADKPLSLFSFEGKDPVIAVAFGKTFHKMNLGQRIEFVVSWITIFLLTFGLVFSSTKLRERYQISTLYIVLGVACYLCLLIAISVPNISSSIGIARIYINMIPVLSGFFVIGSCEFSRLIRVKPLVVMGIIVAIYGLSTSGVIHLVLGLQR